MQHRNCEVNLDAIIEPSVNFHPALRNKSSFQFQRCSLIITQISRAFGPTLLSKYQSISCPSILTRSMLIRNRTQHWFDSPLIYGLVCIPARHQVSCYPGQNKVNVPNIHKTKPKLNPYPEILSFSITYIRINII